MKKNAIGPVIVGLLLMIIGLGYAGNVLNLWDNFTIFFKGWWTLFIILPALVGLINKGFNMSNLIGLIVGLFLLVMQQTGMQMLRNLMVPVILIGIGLIIIFKNKSFNHKRVYEANSIDTFYIPTYTAMFTSKTVVVSSGEVFKGASATSIFGGVELDLRKATIENDIIIDVDTVFAGMDIKLPADVNVRSDVSSVFAGVDVKHPNRNVTGNNLPTVTITGSCVFAGITIR